VSDPNLIHDLQSKLDAQGIYLPEEIEGFVRAYYDEKAKQADLQARLAPAVERFRVRHKEAKESEDGAAVEQLEGFRRDLGAFVRAYDFLSQIIDYGDTDLEKRSLFFKHLAPLIAAENLPREIDLSAVLMTHYNLKDLGKRRLKLAEEPEESPTLKPLTDAGTHAAREPEKVYLSAVIRQRNELFEGQLTDADLLNYAQHIRDKMMESETLATQAAANKKDQFGASPDFRRTMMDAVIAAYENHETMSEQVMKKDTVQEGLAMILLDLVYQGFEKRRGGSDRAASA
jgi:type I restriction enzyme R subunit